VSWSSLPADRRAAIAEALTQKQLDVYKLHMAGYGYRRMALFLEVTDGAVRGHLDRAMLKIRKLDEQEEAA
jgi:DNA-binding CsgD family transcriptional regulator